MHFFLENYIYLITFVCYFTSEVKSTNLTKFQGEIGPENVDTTEAVSSLNSWAKLGRPNIFCPRTFLPSLVKDMLWVSELMLFDPNCWMPRECLLLKGVAVLKPPFMLRFERRLLLVLGLDPKIFSCSTTTWLCTFFISYGGNTTSSERKHEYNRGNLIWESFIIVRKSKKIYKILWHHVSKDTYPLTLLLLLLFLP